MEMTKKEVLREYYRERAKREREKMKGFTVMIEKELAEPFVNLLKEKGISYRQWLKNKMIEELGEERD